MNQFNSKRRKHYFSAKADNASMSLVSRHKTHPHRLLFIVAALAIFFGCFTPLAAPALATTPPAKKAKSKNRGVLVTGVTATGATAIAKKNVLGDKAILHFVTPKGTGDVTLTATLNVNTAAAKASVSWEGATQDATDKLKATVSKTAAAKNIVKIKLKGKVKKELRVWIVWCSITGSVSPVVVTPIKSGALRVGTQLAAPFTCTATVNPATIITDGDRPDFSGANTTPPPGGNNMSGDSLAGGADKKWDMSRKIAAQIQVNAANPALTMHPTEQASTFPAGAEGNDDAGTGDENNDPYGGGGKITSSDRPSRNNALQGGNVGSTYVNKLWFKEFARLEIEGTWQVVSDFQLWRVEFKFNKDQVTEALWALDVNGDGDKLDNVSEADLAQDTNGDGDQLDSVGYWNDNGSASANDNAGSP